MEWVVSNWPHLFSTTEQKPAQSLEDESGRLVGVVELARHLRRSRSTIWRWYKKGTKNFPAPILLPSGNVAWTWYEIQQWKKRTKYSPAK